MDEDDNLPPFDFGRLSELMEAARWVLYNPWHVDQLEPDDFDTVDCTVAAHPGPHYEETIATFSGCNHSSVDNASLVAYVMTHLKEIVRLANLGASVENPARITEQVGDAAKAAAMKAVRDFFEAR